MTEVYPGQVLAGKYRIERVLGQGGMGVVVAATHLQLDERVAIKFLLPEALMNAEAVGRFAREARAAVKIKGEHVARVIDVGTLETGAPYMVMEYLHGKDLAAMVRDRGALPPTEAVDAILQACEALAEAHALGIVHRDVKPANLFVTTRPDGTPSVKVLDFGISKVTNPSASDNSLTKTSTVMGSPLYMSPEQMTAARDVDARSDIWAVGAILYELLVGQVPFNAETLPQICGLILTAPPRMIRELAPHVPEGLQAIVLRCLAKDRNQRFANISELAAVLTPFGSRATSRSYERISRILGSPNQTLELPPPSGPVQSPAIAQTGPEPAPGTSSTQSNWGQTPLPKTNALPLVLAALFGLIAAAAIGVFLLVRSKAHSTDKGPETPASVAAPASPAPGPEVVPGPDPAPPPAEVPPPPSATAAKTSKPETPAKPASKPPVAAKSLVAVKSPAIAKSTATAKPAPAPPPAPAAAKPKDLLGGRH